MTLLTSAVLTALVTAVVASPGPVAAPAITPGPDIAKALAKRATCTFSGSSGYSLASVSQKDCATIVLDSLTVPGGETLNLSELEDDTTVSGNASNPR